MNDSPISIFLLVILINTLTPKVFGEGFVDALNSRRNAIEDAQKILQNSLEHKQISKTNNPNPETSPNPFLQQLDKLMIATLQQARNTLTYRTPPANGMSYLVPEYPLTSGSSGKTLMSISNLLASGQSYTHEIKHNNGLPPYYFQIKENSKIHEFKITLNPYQKEKLLFSNSRFGPTHEQISWIEKVMGNSDHFGFQTEITLNLTPEEIKSLSLPTGIGNLAATLAKDFSLGDNRDSKIQNYNESDYGDLRDFSESPFSTPPQLAKPPEQKNNSGVIH